MNTYTFINGVINEGIAVNPQNCLCLGQRGNKGKYVTIPVYKQNPAVIVRSRRIMCASPVIININEQGVEKSFCTLSRPSKISLKLLVNVCTRFSGLNNTTGYWVNANGNPTLVACGSGTRGYCGAFGSWQDGLLVMDLMDAIYVYCEDASRPEVLVNISGKLIMVPYNSKGIVLA